MGRCTFETVLNFGVFSFGGPKCLVKVIQKPACHQPFIAIDFVGSRADGRGPRRRRGMQHHPVADYELGTVPEHADAPILTALTMRARQGHHREQWRPAGRIKRQQLFCRRCCVRHLDGHPFQLLSRLNNVVNMPTGT